MNEKAVKKLRKQIYGEQSLKQKRSYLRGPKGDIINHPESLRAIYQQARKA